jgi:hypothetical protein
MSVDATHRPAPWDALVGNPLRWVMRRVVFYTIAAVGSMLLITAGAAFYAYVWPRVPHPSEKAQPPAILTPQPPAPDAQSRPTEPPIQTRSEVPVAMRGTLQKMDGNNLTIVPKSGKEANVTLKDGAPVIAVTKGAISDIKSNTFVGITAMPQPDGTQKAVEVQVFEESLRGTGEGHYPWDLTPNSTMTNGAVAQQVKKVEGNTLQVKYKDGEKTIVVPSDAEVVNLVAGGKADLKTGAHVFIPRWEKQGDGTWQATVVVVGRDGITPPM